MLDIIRFVAAVLLVTALHSSSCFASRFVAVLQNESGVAHTVIYNSSGNELYRSSNYWQFSFPLVEATFDNRTQRPYIITYPTGSPATLFVFNSTLGVVNTFVSANLSYFDLQYCAAQNTTFGIVVSSTYGRVLSQFTAFGAAVKHRPIQALPYMWYVNASTFDSPRSRYFGLLNNFPGQPNSTTAQKLAVGLFNSFPGSAVFYDVRGSQANNSDAVLHFIAWSEPTQKLIGLGQCSATSICFVDIDPSSGNYSVVTTVAGFRTGPIFAAANDAHVFACIVSLDGRRHLAQLNILNRAVEVVYAYSDSYVVAAVARMD